MKLSAKIISFGMLMLVVTVLVVAGLSVYRNATYNEQVSYERIESASNALKQEIQGLLERSKQNAFSISQSARLISALEEQDFNRMKAALDEMNQHLQADTISITDAEGVVLIRQHEPDKLGDSILKQSNVQKALSGEILTTVEPGALVKLSCRTGAPIYGGEGEIIGTVVTGYAFENSDFLDALKALHKTELTIFAGTESIATTVTQNGQRALGTQLAEKTAKIVLEEKGSYSGAASIFGGSYLTRYDPLLDAEGNSVGAIFVGLSREEASKATMASILYMSIAALIILAISSFFVLNFVNKSIKQPMLRLAAVSDQLAEGRLDVDVSDIRAGQKDEVAVLTHAMYQMVSRLRAYVSDITCVLSSMSENDFTVESAVDYTGDFTAIGSSLQGISSSLNQTLHLINTAAEQVSAGSDQVASGAQALAEGSTEQAGFIDTLNASVERIAAQAAESLEAVNTAALSARKAGEASSAGNDHMRQLTEAMGDIDSASNQIAGITKVIEDIAFQTNILSLNAAIEAARAGTAGKGFAVVADEVRNLAAKSAEAAKQTGSLIQYSVNTVAKGAEITAKTVEILKDLGVSAQDVSESFSKIKQASAEQAGAIEQIRQGLSQVSAVVQTNAATAEENSAASQEMSAQAATLRHEVGKFRLNTEERRSYDDAGWLPPEPEALSLSEPLPLPKPEPLPLPEPRFGQGESMGKYF